MSEINAAWNKISWLFAVEVGSHQIAVGPSSAGYLRYLAMGEISVVCFNLAIPDDSPITTSLEQLKQHLATASFQDLAGLGYECFVGTFEKGDILYLPSGWMELQTCNKGLMKKS